MKFSTKMLIGSGLLLSILLGYTLTFGASKEIPQKLQTKQSINYEEAEKIAQEFITANLGNEFWKDEVPTPGDGTPMYMEKDIPSYIEYEMLCKKENGCGFVLINLDGDDVFIPGYSVSDMPPSTILTQKSGVGKEKLKFYYFAHLNVYAQNIENGTINAIDPQVDIVESEGLFIGMTDEEKEELRNTIREHNASISKLFAQQKEFVTKYKQSEEFAQYTQQKKIGDDIIPNSGNWIRVPGTITQNCPSRVPCYDQYIYRSGSNYCWSGCSPVAAAIIFGYHDRNTKPNLIPGVAPDVNYKETPHNIRHLIPELRYYMGTTCKSPSTGTVYVGSTEPNNIYHSRWYPKYQGFDVSHTHVITTTPSTAFNYIELKVNQGMPLMLGVNNGVSGHTVVAYGYQENTYKWIMINAGWGPTNHPNYTMNLESFQFGESNLNAIHGLTTMDVY